MKGKTFFLTVLACVSMFLLTGYNYWITHVDNWLLTNCQIGNPTITNPDANYMALSTAGNSNKYVYSSVGRTSQTAITVDNPLTAYTAAGIDSGLAQTAQKKGFVAIGDNADTIVFSVQLPQDFIVTGTASDLVLTFDAYACQYSFSDSAALTVLIYSQSYGYDTPVVNDTAKFDSGTYSGYLGLTTLSGGIGATGNITADDKLMVVVRGVYADGIDTVSINGVRIEYRVGHEITQ